MTTITVALVALAAGWVFVRLWLRTRYMALKEAGHPQYFGAAVAGVVLLLLGASIHAWALAAFPSWYPPLEQTLLSILPQSDDKAGGMDRATLLSFASGAAWALLVAGALPWLLNLPFQSNKTLKRAILKSAGAFDGIESISSHALDCAICLLITLKNGKVYVGTPLSLSTLDIERKWFAIFPILSGYRGEGQKLELPVNYGYAYQELLTSENAGQRIAEFRVLLAVSEIVSIQTFDVATYFELFRKKVDSSASDEENAQAGAQVNAASSEEESSLSDAFHEATPESYSTVELTDEEGIQWDGKIDFVDSDAIAELSADERSRLRAYYGFLLLLMLAVLVLPYSVCVSLALVLVSGLFAAASIHEKADPEMA